MGLLKKLEQTAARKLQSVFQDAKTYADQAVGEIEKAEKALAEARTRAVDAVQRQHESAVEAAKKAREIADQLEAEAKSAEDRVVYYENILKNSNG